MEAWEMRIRSKDFVWNEFQICFVVLQRSAPLQSDDDQISLFAAGVVLAFFRIAVHGDGKLDSGDLEGDDRQ